METISKRRLQALHRPEDIIFELIDQQQPGRIFGTGAGRFKTPPYDNVFQGQSRIHGTI